MRSTKLVLAVVLVLFFSPSNAALVAYWEYDEPNPVVGPMDTIELRATIYNDISSDSRLVCCGQSAGGEVGGVIASSGHSWGSLAFNELYAPSNPYDAFTRFDLGLPGTFDGLDLAPGESSGFIFRTLVPHDGPVTEGVYTFTSHITIRTNENPIEAFTIRPNEPLFVTVTSVPIPGTIYLFIGGLGFLAKISGRRRQTQLAV